MSGARSSCISRVKLLHLDLNCHAQKRMCKQQREQDSSDTCRSPPGAWSPWLLPPRNKNKAILSKAISHSCQGLCFGRSISAKPCTYQVQSTAIQAYPRVKAPLATSSGCWGNPNQETCSCRCIATLKRNGNRRIEKHLSQTKRSGMVPSCMPYQSLVVLICIDRNTENLLEASAIDSTDASILGLKSSQRNTCAKQRLVSKN